jgi:hypothetical protein
MPKLPSSIYYCKNKFPYIVSFVLALLISAQGISAADTDTVTATVTVQNISLTVSDGTVTYGTLAVSSSANTAAAGLDDTQTITNNGNITEDFNIKGQNSGDWTIHDTTIGADTYVHEWCTSDCDGTPTWNGFDADYEALASAISSSGTQDFDLRLNTPSSSSVYTQ